MSTVQKNAIWVVIPGYNEEKYLAQVLKKVRTYTKHIIFVDDGSVDNSVAVARKYTAEVLRHTVNLGKGAALLTGCEYAFEHLDAQAVILLDSDDQHDPAEMKLFLEQLRDGCDLVFGVRTMDSSMPLYRIALNRLASLLVYGLFGSYIPDIPSGYKALTKKAFAQVKWQATDYAVEMEIAARAARYKIPYAVVNIKTIYHDYERGMTVLDVLSMVVQVISWRFTL